MEPGAIMTAYQGAVTNLRALEDQLRDENKRHEARVEDLRRHMRVEKNIIAYAEKGGDAADFEIAARVLDVYWVDGNETPETKRQIGTAIRLLQDGSDYLTHTYLGVKSYDRWDSQIADSKYGWGPTHGYVWFRIGYNPDYREKPPTEEERLACIRYLNAIRDNPGLRGIR